MTIQEQIKDLQRQIDALKAEAAKQDDAWPKDGDEYYTVNSNREVSQ